MASYFLHTGKGQQRASQIIPEPFFVHSDLTTGIQLADLVAYLVNWGYHDPDAAFVPRPELTELVEAVFGLRYRTTREIGGDPDFVVWSFAYITDLRTREEREER